MSFFNFLKIFFLVTIAGHVSAQPWFNWEYTGPDTIVVGANCRGALQWGGDNKIICTPVDPPEQVVIAKNFKTISGGYFQGNLVPGGTTVIVTYEAMDNQGHTEEFSFSIYFADKTPPVFNPASLPSDITLSCGTSLPPVSITATDNCTPAFQIQITQSVNFPPNPCSGVYQRTFTARDQSGNTATYVQNITLTPENIPPVITTEAQSIAHNCTTSDANTAFHQWISTQGGAVASDNCGILGWTTIPASPALGSACNTPVTVIFVVSDFCGNKDSTTATFVIVDEEPPVLHTGALDMLASCDDNPENLLTQWLNDAGGSDVTDNCLSETALLKKYFYQGVQKTISQLTDILEEQLNGPAQSVVIGGEIYDNVRAALDISFEISDYCGQSVSTQAIFAVLDTTPPVIITEGADTTTSSCALGSLDADFTAWYISGAGATGSDECDSIAWTGTPTLAEALAILQGSPTLCNQSISVYFQLTDGSGNVSADGFEAVYRLHDVTGPFFQDNAEDYQLVCSGAQGVQDSLQAWIERKGGAQIEDCNNAAWDHFEWADNAGNDGSGQFGAGPYPQVADNGCDQYITLYFFARDDCGNFSRDSARFNLGDNEAPVADVLPGDTTITCDQPLPVFQPVFTDNCGLAGEVVFSETSTQDNSVLSCAHYTYQITRTWTATDECGNQTVLTQVISVIDTLPPQPDMPFVDLFLQCTDDINEYLINFSDQCSFINVSQEGSSTQSANPGDCAYYNYLIEQNFAVRDACLNEKTYSRIITVSDEVAPEIENTEPLVLNCTDSTQIAGILRSLASDNCANDLTISVVRLDTGNPGLCSSDNFQKWLLTAEDPCGNYAEDTILVNLIDDIPPVITENAQDLVFYCGDETDFEAAFNDWVEGLAGADAEDACGSVHSFVAVAGSYDLNDPATFPGVLPVFTAADGCGGGAVTSLSVDVVFYDQCNNASVTKSKFIVLDTLAPQLLACPSDVIIIAAAGQCAADLQLEAPSVLDQCANQSADSLFTATAAVTSSNPGNSLTPVDDVKIQFSGLFAGGAFATFSTGVLTVGIENGDVEGDAEFFNIYDENNELLGRTEPSEAQCGQSVTQLSYTQDQFDSWISDGSVTFYARPNDPAPLDGGYTVNDICGNTTITISLPVSWNNNDQLAYTYKLDTHAVQQYVPGEANVLSLKEGGHTIVYTVTDCGGNSVSCTQSVTIRDTIAPEIVCPGDITITIEGNTCDTLLEIPLPLSMTDNCGLANDFVFNVPADTATAWLTFAANPNLQNYIAQDKTYTFYNVGGNVTQPVLLNIFLKGDVESGGEYFTIIGEDDVPLGTTEAGPGHVLTGSCNKVSTIYFNIPPAKFNSWAADGAITFRAVSNNNFSIPPGNNLSGINPCGQVVITSDGQTDSTSFMFMQLKYSTFTPPSYFATGATGIPLTTLAPPYAPPRHHFTAGVTYFSYTIADVSGNEDTCTVRIEVRDTIAPEAICKNATLHIHPSGIFPGELTPDMIDGGSYDNCSIDSMYVSRSAFTCADIGTQPEVVLYVVDNTGAIDSCRTQVSIDKALLTPGYSLGLCDNDSLRLFANIPDLDLFDQYTYTWTGPNNFSSNEANPVIPHANAGHSGSYKLTVTGFNGCGGEGIIQVFINDEINTPIIGARDSSICENTGIILFTQPYTGSIRYKWYEGFAPAGVLLDSTIVPQYSLSRPPGTYYFYVVVSENDCISNPSASLEIKVVNNPVAVVDQSLIEVCEGGSIMLGTPLSGSYKYAWTGPNGFTSGLQYPPAISPATLNNAGVYSLVVSADNCISEPANVTVTVSKRPAQPAPASNAPVCTDNELRLISNISAGIDSFIWKRPDGTLFTTASNPFVIPQSQPEDNGLWTLTLKSGGCYSLESAPVHVEVTQESAVVINYDGPVCEGDSVRLTINPYPGATFKWTGPNGFTSTASNPLVKAAAGSYAVTVTTSAGCIATGSVVLDMNPKPRINALTTNAHNCQYPDEAITFNYTANLPEEQLQFLWRGPGGYISTEPHPSIPASQFINGVYAVVATSDDGCVSDTARITISITLAPAQPIIQGSNRLCSGDTLTLTVANLPSTGLYIWSTPAGDISTTSNVLTITNIQASHAGDYSVIFEQSGCRSRSSLPYTVTVIRTPARPVIIGDPTVCLGDSIVLEISNAPDYVYQWTGPGSITSSQKRWVIYPSQASNAGNYFLTLVNDGCASETSDAFTLVINQPPPAPALADAVASICVNNQGAVLTLCVTSASATPGANYTFYNSALTNPVAGPTNGLCANVTNFGQFINGVNTFYAIATLNTCPSEKSVPVSVLINYPPEEQAVTGKVRYVCEGNETRLSANTPSSATGHWRSLTAGVTIDDPSSPGTRVSGLSEGQNVFVWSLDYNDCLDYSRDTMIVWVTHEIRAVDDIYRTLIGEDIVMDVLINDLAHTPVTIEVVSQPSNGTTEIQQDQRIIYHPGNSGDYDKLSYRICVAGCPELCSTANIVIDIDKENDCLVPNIITPNNDGINDNLRIPCLDGPGQNNSRLLIFNEWGSQVYEASPYLNNWNGQYKGSDLPSGTYYFVFDRGDQSPAQKGFLIIKR